MKGYEWCVCVEGGGGEVRLFLFSSPISSSPISSPFSKTSAILFCSIIKNHYTVTVIILFKGFENNVDCCIIMFL